MITLYSFYDKEKRYAESHKGLDEYIELSKEMFGEESSNHAYSHFLKSKTIMMQEGD
jgi:hypothetical protein